MTELQQRLFRLAPEALTVSAHYEWPHGWVVSIKMRRADEDWTEAAEHFYSDLSTDELGQVLEAVLPQLLGL